MTVVGQNRKWARLNAMSGLPPIVLQNSKIDEP